MVNTYRRRLRSPFRVIDGNVLIGGVGHETMGIGGAATFVWLVLDQPRTAERIAAEITATWPELGTIDIGVIEEALAVLVDCGLIEVEPESEPATGPGSATDQAATPQPGPTP